ncbi:winged helix-turn-helix domain-containing protein [Catellatospora tritici]|uniref:winged helix-turn-helix domain-containing protein n=1 Tax=Catellatospora tritici TaxID=2851566 RepID=UPI001C2D16C0|nr:winged helix-turn-helix domain-containing protein [Catellatospora tritici]MBV1849552.1 winged helix-turn-helix domain-containing protein [Catellatospora tritici]
MDPIPLTAKALSRLRIVPHALWEVLASAALLAHHGTPQFPYRLWAREASVAVASGRGARLVRWAAGWPDGLPPAFLLPSPPTRVTSLRDACAEFRAQPPEEISARLRHHHSLEVPPAFRSFESAPARALAELADLLDEYIEAILRPDWGAVWEILKEDLAARAERLAVAGVDDVLGNLHTRVRWNRPSLSLVTGAPVCEREPASVTLVPVVFLRDRVITSCDGAGGLAIGYQARGAGDLAIRMDRRRSGTPDRLELLLGRARADILRLLVSPRTTAAIARELALAPSTVSEHLGRLVGCGMAVRTRRTNKVLYSLSDGGRLLLRSAQEPSES